jgi:peptidoglycan/xylan/chitin deacetylase (PgdA/CDA1 family)
MTSSGGALRSGMLLALLAVAAPASAGTRVVFTIDVESNETYTLPEQVDAVCTDRAPCGLMQIARLLQDRGWSGTFFLNAYEERQFGAQKMRDMTLRLQRLGHDVELHTHPDAAYDPKRHEMYEYSLDEQTTIVRDGVRLLEGWTGQPVVAHRAGAYSADENTLIALERNGIPLDSSLFWDYPKSKLNALPLPRNSPGVYRSVLELPVTSYMREDRPGLLPMVFAPISVVRKLDVNWAVNAKEMQDAVDAAVEANLPVVVVFLHSFSFMSTKTDNGPEVAPVALDAFRGLLDHIAAARLPVASMRQLAADPALRANAAVDPTLRVTVHLSLPQYVWHRMKGSAPFTAATTTAFGLLALVLAVATRRFVGRRTFAAATTHASS